MNTRTAASVMILCADRIKGRPDWSRLARIIVRQIDKNPDADVTALTDNVIAAYRGEHGGTDLE